MRRGERKTHRGSSILFLFLFAVFIASFIIIARLHDHRYPPTITNSISLDAKIRFLRQNRHLFRARTVITGSSLCLNNVDVSYLNSARSGAAPFVNLSAWGMQITGTRRFLDLFLEHAPYVGNVVLVGQIVDFRSGRSESPFDKQEVWSYISGKENLLFGLRHFNLWKSLENWRTFDRLSGSNQSYDGLLFDETGTVLLDIPEAKLNQKRWNTYGLNTDTDEKAFKELEELCAGLRTRNIRLIFLAPPVRRVFYNYSGSLLSLKEFKKRAHQIVVRYDGIFVDADERLHLDDDCFIDMMHLNRRGARKLSELLASYL